MTQEKAGLGEQALNKLAEVALSTQLDQAERLEVRVSPEGGGVLLEDIHYPKGKELSPELTRDLMEKVSEIVNLRNFEMEGISLRIHQIEVETGKVTLQAEANVTQFPSV